MSALPPKADMSGARINVCFVPLADVEGLAALLMYRATCRSTPRYPKKG